MPLFRSPSPQLVSSNPPAIGGAGNLFATYDVAGSVVGNVRGQSAVDLQQSRLLSTEVAYGNCSVIGGGSQNKTDSVYATVAGGLINYANGARSAIGGGSDNTASTYATIAGGLGNNASGQGSVIGGGSLNTASGSYAKIGGGAQNTASVLYATISGGYHNNASGQFATVAGGANNSASYNACVIGGGQDNTASNNSSTVGGGRGNISSSRGSFVGGGYYNTASAYYTTTGGGKNNTASSTYATVGGGNSNTASSDYASTVGGGENNTASADYSTVGGGTNNTASGYCSTTAGGKQNTASSTYATVSGGGKGLADRYGMVAHASGQFAAQGDAQAVMFVMRNTTTNNTATQLFLDGVSVKLTIPSGKILACTINISGIRSTGATGAHYIRKVMIKNVGGTTSLVGTVSTIGTDVEDSAGYDVSVTANNTTDTLDIAVTGATSETLRWTAVVQGLEIIYGM